MGIHELKLSREQVAMNEVGHTEISPGVTRFLVVSFLIVIYLVPVIEQIAGVAQEGENDSVVSAVIPALKVFDIAPSRGEIGAALHEHGLLGAMQLLNADVLRSIHEFEAALEDDSIFARKLIPPMQSLLVGWLRAGNENAYCGRDGWLFYRPGIDLLTGRGFLEPKVLLARSRAGDEWNEPPQPDPVRAIVQFRDELAVRDIELVVMPAPAKASIYPEQFSRRYDGARVLRNPSHGEFARRLKAEGIRLCDVTDALMEAKAREEGPLYLATDTHWTPRGLDLAAKRLGDFIREHQLVDEHPPAGLRRTKRVVTNSGDVTQMLTLPPGQKLYPPETVSPRQVTDARGEPLSPQAEADVLLLGDSYSNIYHLAGMGWGTGAGLAEQLAAELQRPVEALLINDAGAHATRRQLARDLARGRDRLAGKRLVILEFASRELAVGDWKTDIALVAAAPTGPMKPAVAESGPLRIRGTVAALTRPPRPGTVPYRDCIVALHLAGPRSEQGPLDEDQIVVFLWGMRDNAWTAAARYEVGQLLDLTLVPWSEVEGRYGSYNRMELDDDELLFLDVFWAQTDADEPAQRKEQPEAESAEIEAEAAGAAPASGVAREFTEDLRAKVGELELQGRNTLVGKDGWLFFGPELRSLTVGPFWGERAAAVSRASNPRYADPLPAILDFHKQLEGAGIELIVMPVPAKAVIYPEMVSDTVIVTEGQTPPRLDATQQAFYRILEEQGMTVLDPADEFLRRRFDPEGRLFCQQDTHWSGRACGLAAGLIADFIKDRPWLAEVPKTQYASETRQTEITGDLWHYLGAADRPKETLALTHVNTREGDRLKPVGPWRDSPIVLLGDSHNLVFQAGSDMHARGAGLADQLALELGFPVDLVAVRGSGATPARMSLLRRRDNLAGKRLVIWCFTAREFTESPGGWRPLPVIRSRKSEN